MDAATAAVRTSFLTPHVLHMCQTHVLVASRFSHAQHVLSLLFQSPQLCWQPLWWLLLLLQPRWLIS
jgi:hypothetical protein